MLTFIEAIAKMEGFGVSGVIPTRDNNPGDIVYGKWAIRHGATQDGRFAKWMTVKDGVEAERTLLKDAYIGLTVHAALNKWAPPSDGNDTSAYESGVCKLTGFTPDTVLTEQNIG